MNLVFSEWHISSLMSNQYLLPAAPSHHLSQCWLRPMSPSGVIMPQCVIISRNPQTMISNKIVTSVWNLLLPSAAVLWGCLPIFKPISTSLHTISPLRDFTNLAIADLLWLFAMNWAADYLSAFQAKQTVTGVFKTPVKFQPFPTMHSNNQAKSMSRKFSIIFIVLWHKNLTVHSTEYKIALFKSFTSSGTLYNNSPLKLMFSNCYFPIRQINSSAAVTNLYI